MEYLHASLILHSAGKKITEKSVTDVLKAAGIDPDSGRIKGLIAALNEVDIEEAIKSATVAPVAAPAAAATAPKTKAEQPEPEPEEEEDEEEEEAAGLGSLFG
ncbi:MAG: 50S ribosomal protein P1 [Candidatus Heimdallarchaeota archaeon]|nr:50S ribosomal protein P1 [Candidatus Heimdallarchaeota archaeon]